ncbi:MAG TPA: alpha/beta fold hydrolase, partial [Anaerolineaceae bacterium]|nr:alpha/beta fold hydrolase [Anaerolineaceae bacterium]
MCYTMRMTIVWILIAGLILILAAAGLYFTRLLITPRMFSSQASYTIEVEYGRLDEAAFTAYEKQEVRIPSPFGYSLYGLYFPCQDAKKTVILAHGITYTLYGTAKYFDMFRQRGFNVLMIDHRHHGQSGGASITYGYYEKHDLAAWFEWALAATGPDG